MTDVRARRVAESGWIIEEADDPVAVARWLGGLEGVIEAWPAFGTVGVESDLDVERLLEGFAPAELGARVQTHVVSTVYDGEDLPASAEALGMTVAEFVRVHTSAEFTVAAIGFAPGFGYLSGLPLALHGLPRRPAPRPRVPAGSVAVTEAFCAVYPAESPGGWNLIGRTPLEFADVAARKFLLSVGDRVVFRAEGML